MRSLSETAVGRVGEMCAMHEAGSAISRIREFSHYLAGRGGHGGRFTTQTVAYLSRELAGRVQLAR